MNRVRLLVVLLGGLVVLLTFGLPASALAGTYTWNLASSFTATAPGANPDHDRYGATPWSYEISATGSHAPSTFSALPTFQAAVSGGLSQWSDPTSGALVGINPSSTPVTVGTSTYPPGQVFVQPGSGGQLVAIGWTSPLGQTATISISTSVTGDTSSTAPCASSTTWSLDQNGNSLDSGATPATSTTSFSTSTTVNPGGSVYLTISAPANSACAATGISFQIQAPGTPPTLSLTKPTEGSSSPVAEPAFSGSAGTGFGDSGQVTLRLYSGIIVSGTPVQTLTATQSAGAWSVTPTTPLPEGIYTAQAEQDDLATPADAGLSPPITFAVLKPPPVTISSLGSKPLRTDEPILSGIAGSASNDNQSVSVVVFAGSTATGTPIRKLSASVGKRGTYSVRVKPALADGLYTAASIQGDAAGALGFSSPMTFSVDTHAPTVGLLLPRSNSRSDPANLVFQGRAGTESGDSRTVAVSLYRGTKATGRPLGKMDAKATGSTWSLRWRAPLAPGVYTAQASQKDAAGHTGLSAAHTFRVLEVPPVIGGAVTMGPTGMVELKVACDEPPDDTCTGTVLVLTRGNFQPVAGGPSGHLSIIFAHVSVEGGHDHTLSKAATPVVVAALRGHATVPVTVVTNLTPLTGKAIHLSVDEVLRRVSG